MNNDKRLTREVSCRSKLDAVLKRDDPSELAQTVIAVALDCADADIATQLCLFLSKHRDPYVRGNAILGFGHLARRFGTLDEATVKPIVEEGIHDKSEHVRGQSWAAAEDLTHFMGMTIHGYEPE